MLKKLTVIKDLTLDDAVDATDGDGNGDDIDDDDDKDMEEAQ